MERNHQESVSGGSPGETNIAKLFVGGLSNATTEDMLKNHFSKYGQVEEASIIFDRVSGNSRGFGFILFGDSSMADQAFQDQHIIHGRKVDVKRAISRPQCTIDQQRNDNGTEIRSKKIFVGGLPPNLTEKELKDCFKEFGTITNVVVMYNKVTGEPRKFGFVTFDSEDSVVNVLRNRYYKLKGKYIEVKKAEPKKNYPNQQNFGGCPYCYNTTIYHGGYYNYPGAPFGSLVDVGNYYWYNSPGTMSYGHPAYSMNSWVDTYRDSVVEDSTAANIDASEDTQNLNGQS